MSFQESKLWSPDSLKGCQSLTNVDHITGMKSEDWVHTFLVSQGSPATSLQRDGDVLKSKRRKLVLRKN